MPAARKVRWGKCSNCSARNVVVQRIAGCQVCFNCAKRLPGHLLRKVFPVVHDPKLAQFLRDHQVVSTTAVERPQEEEREEERRPAWFARIKLWLKKLVHRRP